MARRKRILNLFIGVIIGFFASFVFKQSSNFQMCQNIERTPFKLSSISEKSAESLLFVGVMTAEKYLNDRAKTVYDTWGANVPGKILFFSSESSFSDDIPLVALPGIDDRYPPQKKSFHMLKYMHDNHIDDYEWFLRADDDCFIRMDRLEILLRSVDSRKPWFIGQTGKGNNNEFGLLSLEENENFCMGGPGIILSRETLRRIAPYIERCIENLYTTHEDVELGRCVRKFAGIPCTWSYEMQVILYHNQSGEAAFSGNLKQKEVHRAITMHPVKHPRYMHRLHNYVKGLKVREKQQESLRVHRDIAISMSNLAINASHLYDAELVEDLPLYPESLGSENYLGDPEILGAPISLNRFKAKKLRDIIDWELISKSLYSYKDLNPRRRIGSSFKEGLTDVIREVMESINLYSKQRGRIIDFNEILYGYWRLDPIHGVDLILDMSLTYKKYRGHKMTVPVRRHAYIQQTFTDIQVREITSVKENEILREELLSNIFAKIEKAIPLPIVTNSKPNSDKRYINFILSLSGRYQTFRRFMSVYEDVCIKEREVTRLQIVLYKDDNTTQDYISSLNLITEFRRKYPKSEIGYVVVDETFARGRALQHGVDTFKDDDLLFFIDVDIVFNSKSLLRIRQNTVRAKQIYFPIVLSLYKTNTTMSYSRDVDLSNKNGFWRQFGFGIASLFKSDFVELGGFNTSISGWGLEDVTFYDNVIKSSIKIIRSVDDGLIHIYHPVVCSENLVHTQKEMCLGTKANIFASLQDLQNYYKKYKHFFR